MQNQPTRSGAVAKSRCRSDAVMGEILAQSQYIRKEVEKRTQEAAARLDNLDVDNNDEDAQHRVEEDFNPMHPASPIATLGTLDLPDKHSSKLVKVASVNMYLHRRRNNLAAQSEGATLDPPPCSCVCPFSTGPLLMQRFVLLQRVYQLNCTLYGQGTADDLIKYI